MSTVRLVVRRTLRSVLVLLILACGIPSASWAQEPGEAQEAASETTTESEDDAAPGELTSPVETVAVESSASDEEIRARLESIFGATERFQSLEVRVEEGVVFLAGNTAEQEHRQWATQLARRTQDVVAVVNDLSVDEPPLWTFAPALDELKKLGRTLIAATPLVGIGLVILILACFAGSLIAPRIGRALRHKVRSDLLRNVLEKCVFVFILFLGVYLFLRVSGLTRLALTLVGGTGILGLIVGFAFRDIAENFLASLLISLQSPFRLGDTIEVDGHLGVVQRVTPRGTILMGFTGDYIQIANATVYKSTITNLSANPKVRIDFAIGVGYDTSIAAAQAKALEVLKEHGAVLEDPAPLVLVDELGAATIILKLFFWIDGKEHSKPKVRSSVMRKVVRAFLDAGISLPDEAREVMFPQPVPVQMIETTAQPAAPVRETAAPAPPASPEVDTTESEGDLESEVAELQEQARASGSPEEGQNLLTR